MFFRVLGPLEVVVGGEPFPLRRNRQLTVLAMLLLNAGKPVSVPRLVEAVWGGRPPRTAAAQIQTCIWSLRKMFVASGADEAIIETKPSGYIMQPHDDQLDMVQFDRLVEEARAVGARLDRATAISAYRRALGMYRGPVLAEISSPAVQAIASLCEERRLTVLEDCIDLELSVGLHGELVGRLMELVHDHPLRERFCGQLMLALYGDDRRAEALAAYRTTRQTLVAQLGLEPGVRLQELHRKILTGELDSPHRAAGHFAAYAG
ncbi:AfsR/SARP family transcriptional regulator [Streptomyces sp. NPDC048312]|uniref:Putative regulator component n=1 Tax=Streptomyces melanovinaceus TaxID=1182637 RepID=A0A0A6ZAK4_9ACTN|nr:putative regulator component [Streptomyces melanovinaceus]